MRFPEENEEGNAGGIETERKGQSKHWKDVWKLEGRSSWNDQTQRNQLGDCDLGNHEADSLAAGF